MLGAGGNSVQFSPTYLHPLWSTSNFPTLAGMPAEKARPILSVASAAGLLLYNIACMEAAKPAKSAEDSTLG